MDAALEDILNTFIRRAAAIQNCRRNRRSLRAVRLLARDPSKLSPPVAILRLDDLSLPPRYLTVPSHLPVSELLGALPLPSSSAYYLTSDGRPLPASSTVAALLPSAPSLPHRTLPPPGLRPPRSPPAPLLLRGDGDGGATGAESRDCYLAKKPDKADPNEARFSRFTCCALSGEPLAAPAVDDRLGNLYNKEALIEALLHKRLPKALSHIRGLRDMIPIHLHPKLDAESAGEEVRFQCPITGLEFNGKYQFLALRGCGHVLSMKVLKEVKSSACLVCNKEFEKYGAVKAEGKDDAVVEGYEGGAWMACEPMPNSLWGLASTAID